MRRRSNRAIVFILIVLFLLPLLVATVAFIKNYLGRERITVPAYAGKPLAWARQIEAEVAIHMLKFSPDGKWMVTAAGAAKDAQIMIWDVQTGESARTLPAGRIGVWDLSFSPDGSRLAGIDMDSILRIWDFSSGSELSAVPHHGTDFQSVEYSPDGKYIGLGGWDFGGGNLLCRETADLEKRLEFIGHTEQVWCIAFEPAGGRLVSGSADSTIRFWDLSTGKQSQEFVLKGSEKWGSNRTAGRRMEVGDISISPDGTVLAAVAAMATVDAGDAAIGSNSAIHLWRIHDGTALPDLGGHFIHIYPSHVEGVSFSRDGRWLASFGLDGKVRIWDWANETDIAWLNLRMGTVLRFSPDDTWLAAGTFDHLYMIEAAKLRISAQESSDKSSETPR